MRAVLLALVLPCVVACEPPPEPARIITPGHMPPGAAYHSGSPDLSLRVTVDEVSGTPLGFEPGKAENTDLSLGFVANTAATSMTMLALTNRSKRPLKVDMWISDDGQRYRYTSSCPILAGARSTESWPGVVSWIYVSNPRFLAPDARATTCD
jgi:hypothetical protein